MNDTMENALVHHRSGRLPEAEAIYRRILTQAPDHPEALHMLGLVAWQAGRNDDAMRLMRRALDARPDYVEALSDLGKLFATRGWLEDAVECCRQAIRVQPRNAEAYFNLAGLLTRQHKAASAIENLRRAVALRPDFAEAHNNLGALLLEQGSDDEAIASYRRAVAVRRDYPGALTNLGLALSNRGLHQEAIDCHQRAIALRPGLAEDHYNLGATFARAGKTEEAVANYRKAIGIRPEFAEAHNNLGNLLIQQGHGDAAIAALRKAVTLRPDYAEAHYNLGMVLARNGALTEAQASFQRVIEIAPGNESALHMIAAAQGAPAERAPYGYAAELFDRYADRFDSHLVEELQYRVPEQMAATIREATRPDARLDVLDLGCGTGLVGAALGANAKHLVGVDLSARMLDKARARKLYARLEHCGLLELVMREAPASYDVVTAADVFVYCGRLDSLFAEARHVLRPGGCFAFSIEALDDFPAAAGDGALPDFKLLPSGRFAHGVDYISALATANGFTVERCHTVAVRLEARVPVPGRLVLLKRRAA
jgi:predicted TPR repeat methyltransferase